MFRKMIDADSAFPLSWGRQENTERVLTNRRKGAELYWRLNLKFLQGASFCVGKVFAGLRPSFEKYAKVHDLDQQCGVLCTNVDTYFME